MNLVLTGARVPKELWQETKTVCQKSGLKLSYFVTQALTEKLQELKEEEEITAIIKAREKDPVISLSEMEVYFQSRGLSV